MTMIATPLHCANVAYLSRENRLPGEILTMIQLEMTRDEFEYLLDTLAENIPRQSLSDADFEEKITMLRRYSADEIIVLCKGLLHKEMDDAVASEWIQALNALHVNCEIEFFPGGVRDERYITALIREEVLSPFRGAITRYKWASWLLFGVYLAVFVFLGVSYGWTAKTGLYILLATLFYAIGIVGWLLGNVWLHGMYRSVRYAFLNMLIRQQISYRRALYVVENMTERTTASSRAAKAEKQLYALLANEMKRPFFVRSKRDIEIELEKILQLLRIPIHLYTLMILPLVILAWGICTISVFFFPGLSWLAASFALLKVIGFSLITTNIGAMLFQRAVIQSAQRAFLDAFAISLSQYQQALRILDEHQIRKRRIGVFSGIGNALYAAINVQVPTFTRREITRWLRRILSAFNCVQEIAILVVAFITWGSFAATPFVAYWRWCDALPWWQAGLCALAALCPAFLGMRYLCMPIGDYIVVAITTRIAAARFLRVFPKLHENNARAIRLLQRFAACDRRGKFGLYRVEELLYNSLEEDTPDPTNHPIKNVLSRMLSAGMSLLAFAGLLWLFAPLAWWQAALCCVFALIDYQIFRLLVGYAARFHAGLGVMILKEQTYHERTSRRTTEVLLGTMRHFRRPLPFISEISYAILRAHWKKASDALSQKEWERAERMFTVTFSTLEYLIEIKANTLSTRSKLVTTILPTLSDDLQPEFAEAFMMIGVCQHLSGKLLTARKTLEKSLAAYRLLATANADAYQEQRARLAAHLGICCCQLGDFPNAQKFLDDSHRSYQTFHDERLIIEMWREITEYFLGESTELIRLKTVEDCMNALPLVMQEGHAELLELALLAQRTLAHHLAWFGNLQTILKKLRERPPVPSRLATPAGKQQPVSDIKGKTLSEFDENAEAFFKNEDTKAFFKNLFPDFENIGERIGNNWDKERKERVYQEDGSVDDYVMQSFSLFGAMQKRLLYEQMAWHVEPILPYFDEDEYQAFSSAFPEAQVLLKEMTVDVKKYASKKHPELQEPEIDRIIEMGRFKDRIYLDMRQLTPAQKKRFEQLVPPAELNKRMFRAIRRPFSSYFGNRAKELRWRQQQANWWSIAILSRTVGKFDEAQQALQSLRHAYQQQIAQGDIGLRHELLTTLLALAACLLEEDKSENVVKIDAVMRDLWILLQTLYDDGYLSQAMMSSAAMVVEWYACPPHITHLPENAYKTSQYQALHISETALIWFDQMRTHVSRQAQTRLNEAHARLHRIAVTAARELQQFERAYLLLERGKARVLADQLHAVSLKPGKQVPMHLREQRRKLIQELAPFEWAQSLSPQDLYIFREKQRLLADVNEKIGKHDPAFAAMAQPQPLTRRDFSPLLADDELVLAFEQTDDMLRIYPITKRRGVHTPIAVDISACAIQQRVEQFHAELAKPGELDRESAAHQIGEWLTETLGLVLKEIVNQVDPQQIVFIPHREWHLLPLHLVFINPNDDILEIPFAMRYLPSMQIFCHLRREPSQTGDGCIIANPEGNLPSAEIESQFIHRLRPNDTILMRNAATKKAAIAAMTPARNLHFACHGKYEPDLKAHLSLADGELSAQELFSTVRFIHHPRLTVLSACQTAQIQTTEADEYMGFASSLLYAGTHNVIASLWSVEEGATRLLIEYFYRNVEETHLPLPLALQRAQEQLRKHAFKYECPYYWAGFIVIGEESAISHVVSSG
ncbi:TPR repeat protein [Candidatus Moduliflexus flocculans]|uniref:TPR repeat protein n=1 Tax=Candidatus Moduliflexus flocculans TaxID=1499966 RepID=A0A0S6VXJ2_9BACT|nr:TPR repeat protein [Candidatus Moduliflexus flocculans]